MISSEEENVKFSAKINVNEGEKKGNVEKWLGEIESMMRSTLKSITRSSMLDEGTPRTLWVQKWPGQVVLAVNMIRWTHGAEKAILNGKMGSSDDTDELVGSSTGIGGGPTYGSIGEYVTFLEN